MSTKDKIECAIRHIESANNIDPGAVEIATMAMKMVLAATDNEHIIRFVIDSRVFEITEVSCD